MPLTLSDLCPVCNRAPRGGRNPGRLVGQLVVQRSRPRMARVSELVRAGEGTPTSCRSEGVLRTLSATLRDASALRESTQPRVGGARFSGPDGAL